VAIQRTASAEEIYSDDLPDWIPSISIGAGIYSREVDGVAEGEILSNGSTQSTQIPCRSTDTSLVLCTIFTKGSEEVNGFSLQVQGGLLGPAWEDGPWRPRPFVQGGYGFPFKKRRITTEGQKTDDFDSNGLEADIRVELLGDPQHFWWIGAGVAFQLPVETYPTWIKLGVNYIEDKVDAVGRVYQTIDFDADNKLISHPPSRVSKGLRLSNIGPSFGVEALVARFGPVAIGFSADFFFGFPVGSTKKRFAVEAPGFKAPPTGGPIIYKYDADSPWFFGNAGLRFVWIGDPD
jgi:hypothetical protein